MLFFPRQEAKKLSPASRHQKKTQQHFANAIHFPPCFNEPPKEPRLLTGSVLITEAALMKWIDSEYLEATLDFLVW